MECWEPYKEFKTQETIPEVPKDRISLKQQELEALLSIKRQVKEAA